MDWDDSYDEEWDDALEYGDRDDDSAAGRESNEADASKDGFDPTDIANPVSAYFFLSDDVQDELGRITSYPVRLLSGARPQTG